MTRLYKPCINEGFEDSTVKIVGYEYILASKRIVGPQGKRKLGPSSNSPTDLVT
jgi:hypothetical protein